MKKRIVISVFALSLLATMPAWGQTSVIKRSDRQRQNKQVAKSSQRSWKFGGRVVSEGMILVRDKKTEKFGFINTSGNLVIPCVWDAAYYQFEEGMVAVSRSGKYGFIDKTGQLVIPCKWGIPSEFGSQPHFSEGLAAVKDDSGKCGYIDKTGTVIIPCQFEEAKDFHDGMALVKVKGGVFSSLHFINKEGEIVIKHAFGADFSEGMALFRYEDVGAGFIDKTGKKVITGWKDVKDFKDGLAPVKDNQSGLWGFIDKKGDVVISCKWKDAYSFHDGLARVRDENGREGYIDKTGKLKIPCKWKCYGWNFSDGLAAVNDDNDKSGFIDTDGNLVIPCKWHRKGCSFHEGLAIVQDKNYAFYLIDKKGQVLLKWE